MKKKSSFLMAAVAGMLAAANASPVVVEKPQTVGQSEATQMPVKQTHRRRPAVASEISKRIYGGKFKRNRGYDGPLNQRQRRKRERQTGIRRK